MLHCNEIRCSGPPPPPPPPPGEPNSTQTDVLMLMSCKETCSGSSCLDTRQNPRSQVLGTRLLIIYHALACWDKVFILRLLARTHDTLQYTTGHKKWAEKEYLRIIYIVSLPDSFSRGESGQRDYQSQLFLPFSTTQ